MKHSDSNQSFSHFHILLSNIVAMRNKRNCEFNIVATCKERFSLWCKSVWQYHDKLQAWYRKFEELQVSSKDTWTNLRVEGPLLRVHK